MILFEKDSDILAIVDAILKTQYTWIKRNRQRKEEGRLGYFIKTFKIFCRIEPDNNTTTKILRIKFIRAFFEKQENNCTKELWEE